MPDPITPDVKTEETDASSANNDQTPQPPIQNANPLYPRFQVVNQQKNALKLENEQLKAQLQSQPKEIVKEPDIADFSDDETYRKAQIKHEARQIAQELFESKEQEKIANKKAQSTQERRQNFETQVGMYAAKNPDFDKDFQSFPELRLSPEVSEAIVATAGEDENGLPLGAKVYHHMYQNPAVAQELSGLGPVQAAVRIGQLAATLKKQSKQISNAPNPPGEILGSSGGVKIDFSTLSDNDFEKAYNKIHYGG